MVLCNFDKNTIQLIQHNAHLILGTKLGLPNIVSFEDFPTVVTDEEISTMNTFEYEKGNEILRLTYSKKPISNSKFKYIVVLGNYSLSKDIASELKYDRETGEVEVLACGVYKSRYNLVVACTENTLFYIDRGNKRTWFTANMKYKCCTDLKEEVLDKNHN